VKYALRLRERVDQGDPSVVRKAQIRERHWKERTQSGDHFTQKGASTKARNRGKKHKKKKRGAMLAHAGKGSRQLGGRSSWVEGRERIGRKGGIALP